VIPDNRAVPELVRDPPQEWICEHRRQEEKMTDPFGLSLGGLVIREYFVHTAEPRRLDGLVLHADAHGRPFPTGIICAVCLRERRSALNPFVRGAEATLIQTKRETLGTAVLGQTLFGALALQRLSWAPASIEMVALCTAHEPELEVLLPSIPGCERLRIEIGSLDDNDIFQPDVPAPRRATREIKVAPDLRRDFEEAHGLQPAAEPPLASRELVEAVYETADGLLVVHSSPRTVSLVLAGLVLFFRELLAARHPKVAVRSVGLSRKPDAIVTSILRRYAGCDALGPDLTPW
jgi:hypothetical protein